MPSTDEPDALAGWRLREAPFYRPVAGEVRAFEAAASARLPVLLTGPTGCGKTRFVEHMAWRLGLPLVTLACHEDLTAGDLAGRWLLEADGTRWQDGPLALAARHGGICYLDELVEARSDALVVIHPLADSRRVLPLERRGELLHAHPDFLLVASYNPGYRGLHKALKPSTRQRFTALAFTYPQAADETAIVATEGGIAQEVAARLVALAGRTRRLQADGLDEGASTRLLVHAALLVRAGLPLREACVQAIAAPLTDDPELAAVLVERWGSWLHALWGQRATLTWLEPGAARPVLVGQGDERVLYLPADAHAVGLAATAHAAAHWRFGGPPQPRKGLKPVQQALFELLEDARVEALALRELPGLRALWLPFHVQDAPEGNGFDALLARLSRVLLDPAWDDPHPWVVKARMACATAQPVREIASRLGNDIGQMRLPFNPRTWRMHAAYRDDGSWLWEPQAHAPDSDTTLAADAPQPQAQPAEGLPGEDAPPVLYREWDERIGRYRADWCRVFASTAPADGRRLPAVAAGERLRLARALRSLRGGVPRHAGRASWGDEFHPMALLDARLQRLAGQVPDPHLYRRRIAPPQPLAVQLLLDTSASTTQRCNDGRPLLAHMRDAALTCTAAFEELGHRSALAAFASRTRHRVEWQQLKHWDEAAAAPAVLARAAGLRSGGSTRLGAAVRHAAAEALARTDAGLRPMVLLLSDGEAHDVDAPDPAYLRGDFRRAIAEAEAAGVAVRCLRWPRQLDALPAVLPTLLAT